MPVNRTVTTGGVWALGAVDVPPAPAIGTTYKDTTLDPASINSAWPFKEIVESSKLNEMIFRLTTLMTSLESWGAMIWSAATTYDVDALAMGSDGILYRSLAAANVNFEPSANPAKWVQAFLRYADFTEQMPVGGMLSWPTSTPPIGFLERDGAAVSRATYAALFAVIGTSYGIGDGATTFNLPDARGEFDRGWDHGAGIDPDAAGRTDRGDGVTGDNIGTKQVDDFEDHLHDILANQFLGGLDATGPDTVGFGSGATTGPTELTGGNETRPRNVNVMKIIKY